MTSYNNPNQTPLSQSKEDRETYLALNMAAMAEEEDYTALADVVRQVYDSNFDISLYEDDFRIISTYKTGDIVDGIVKVSVLFAGGFSDHFFVVEACCDSEIERVAEATGMTYTEAAESLINFIAEKKYSEKI